MSKGSPDPGALLVPLVAPLIATVVPLRTTQDQYDERNSNGAGDRDGEDESTARPGLRRGCEPAPWSRIGMKDDGYRADSLVGFEVRGRHGVLGVVVAPRDSPISAPEEIVIVGGQSALLRFHVPLARIQHLPGAGRTVDVDVDVADFAARTADDGSIDLHLKA